METTRPGTSLRSISHVFSGSVAPALLRYATYAVRECVAALQRCVPFPTRVNCGSSRKGVTHQSVLGHISGCRLQNCCSAVDFKMPFFTWFSEYLRLPTSKLSRQGWPRPAGYSSKYRSEFVQLRAPQQPRAISGSKAALQTGPD